MLIFSQLVKKFPILRNLKVCYRAHKINILKLYRTSAQVNHISSHTSKLFRFSSYSVHFTAVTRTDRCLVDVKACQWVNEALKLHHLFLYSKTQIMYISFTNWQRYCQLEGCNSLAAGHTC